MKYILFRILFFAVLLWLSFWIMDACLPYYWGNEGVATKMEYLEGKRASYNVFFMGSSRVYRQVMPNIFDTETEGKTHSFNLGYRAIFNPESYYLLEHFIRKKAAKRTSILIELQSFKSIDNRDLHTFRYNYFIDYSYFSLVKNYYKNQKKTEDTIVNKLIIHNRKNYLGNIIKTGHVREMLLSLIGWGERDARALGKLNDGFQPLDEAATYEKAVRKMQKKYLKKYARDTSRFDVETRHYEKALTQDKSEHAVHLDKINQLISAANRQNYHLIFVLLPTQSDLLPLLFQIDEPHRINMAQPSDYPALYDNQFRFDPNHFNQKGATLFSKALAHEFEKL